MADIRVFISSVQREFAQERRQLCDYIRTDGLLGRFFRAGLPQTLDSNVTSGTTSHPYNLTSSDYNSLKNRNNLTSRQPYKLEESDN